MTQQTKAQIANVVQKTKRTAWQVFGAAFTETKAGYQAVSFTRLLALGCFAMLAWKWLGLHGPIDPKVSSTLLQAGLDVPLALRGAAEVPDSLLWTFWGLLGGKTVESVVALTKGLKGI